MHVFDKITTMKIDTNTLPTNVEALSKLVLELQQKLDQQSQFIEQLLEQIRHHGTRVLGTCQTEVR